MRVLLIILAILLLSACGNQANQTKKIHYQGIEQAHSYYQNRRYQNAAQSYATLYQQHREDRFALLAADSWLLARQYNRSQQLLSSVKNTNDPLYSLILASINLHERRNSQALRSIQRIRDNLNPDLRLRYLRLKAEIYENNQLYIDAAMALIEMTETNPRDNWGVEIDSIVRNLLQAPEDEITKALFKLDTTEQQQGWLEAAYIAYSQDSESSQQWQQRWGNHPAKVFFIQMSRYKNIAVFLPLSGKYKNIAQSIQQGMIAALYRNGSTQQQLNFFDTGSQGEKFSYAWYGAIESGADFMIGPLEKSSIKQLTQFNSSTVPIMLLNQLEEGAENPFGFYQFALSHEDEITNVVNRLVAEKKKRVLLLAPESETGRKLARQFESELLSQGGKVISYDFYPESTHDYSKEIKQALGLNDSIVRARKLQSIISHKIKSTPQIRPDIDAIFIIAKAKQARLLKPQLEFFQAEKIPVYATSQIHTVDSFNPLDQDLNDIRFCQSAFVIDPFVLQEDLNFDIAKIDSNKKFFAFGYDAIALSSRIEWMQRVQNNKTQGMSGQFSIDPQGKIHRGLAWAEFHNGKARLLPPLEPLIKEFESELPFQVIND